MKVKVEISRKSSVFTDGNKKTIIRIPCSNILANVFTYIGTLQFSLRGNHTVYEDSFKYKYKLS